MQEIDEKQMKHEEALNRIDMQMVTCQTQPYQVKLYMYFQV